MSATNMSQEDWEAGAEDRANALLDECKLEREALKAKLAQVEADCAAMREAIRVTLDNPKRPEMYRDWLDRALEVGAGQALLDELNALRKSYSAISAIVGLEDGRPLEYAVKELRATAQRRLELLRQVEEPMSDVVAFGNCDCDIPNGKTCLVCQLSMLHKALTAELKEQPSKGSA